MSLKSVSSWKGKAESRELPHLVIRLLDRLVQSAKNFITYSIFSHRPTKGGEISLMIFK